MKFAHRLLLCTAALTAVLGSAACADAAIVTLGPTLNGVYVSEGCGQACVLINDGVNEPGAQVLAPRDGVILRWHVIEGLTSGEYRLRIADPLGAGTFQFLTTAPGAASSAAPGVQTFNLATPVPIKAGQAIALETINGAKVGHSAESSLGSFASWYPPPADSVSQKAETLGEGTIGFNAEMQPVPTITALNASSGVSTGGTPVTITGTDFEGASGVSFGGVAATSFMIDSESQLTAVTPPGAAHSIVPVMVTTVAGTATSSQNFTYKPPPVYCVVPNLKGKSLKVARVALAKGRCKLGTLKKLAGATTKTGKVVKQGAKPGTKLRVGSKVALTLKPAKAAAHRSGGKKKR